MTNSQKPNSQVSLKTKLRKALNRLINDSSHQPYIKQFCEALIDYQLYQAFIKHDKHNQNKALPDEEALSEVRSSFSLDDLNPYEEAEYINTGADLSQVRKNIGKDISPVFLPH